MTTINLRIPASNETMKLYRTVINNAQSIGAKKFADIPLDLLAVGKYQRVDYYDKGKVSKLAEHFNKNLMDPLTVSPHPEEGKFYIVNGMHRKEAAEINGMDTIECEILQNMPEDPFERERAEAEIFRKQEAIKDKLTPVSVHKANMICGEQASLDLDEIIKKHGILYKTNKNKGRAADNTLTGFSVSLKIVRIYGKEVLDDIYDVIIRSGWQMESCGLSNIIISVIRNLFVYDPEARENKDEIVKILRHTTPKMLQAEAISAYKLRGSQVAMSLYLEDLAALTLGIDKNIHSKYKVDVA